MLIRPKQEEPALLGITATCFRPELKLSHFLSGIVTYD